MRSALALAACALLLGGCESFGDLTPDAFEPGTASPSRFALDSGDCIAEANGGREYGIAGITGTHAERHEIFNRAFTRCMNRNGYTRRGWSPDVPDPYAIDPFPG